MEIGRDGWRGRLRPERDVQGNGREGNTYREMENSWKRSGGEGKWVSDEE